MSPSRLFTGFKMTSLQNRHSELFSELCLDNDKLCFVWEKGVRSSKWTLTKPNQPWTQGRPPNCIFSHYWHGKDSLTVIFQRFFTFYFPYWGSWSPEPQRLQHRPSLLARNRCPPHSARCLSCLSASDFSASLPWSLCSASGSEFSPKNIQQYSYCVFAIHL